LADFHRGRADVIYSLTQLLWSAAEHLAPVPRSHGAEASRERREDACAPQKPHLAAWCL